jgi:CBS domain-containing protein
MDEVPEAEVSRAMTADPVMVRPHMAISDLARMMIDGGIHRVIVVDEERRPLGIASTTDIVNAVAHTPPH